MRAVRCGAVRCGEEDGEKATVKKEGEEDESFVNGKDDDMGF
jgi:hypothetical protein